MKATHSKAVKIQRMIFYISIYLEILLAFIVIIAIGITLLSVPHGLLVLYQGGGFNNFLQALFDIIIGIELLKMLCAWKEQADKLSAEEISRENYDQWRYNYPKFDTTQHWAKVSSKELSDTLAKAFKDKLKTD